MMSSYADGSSLRPSPSSLRELQRKALLKLLNLNVQDESTAGAHELVQVNGEPVWKFLVFDKLGQDVISSVLRVSDLREAGVTVHMQLKADRHQMDDVPASTYPLTNEFVDFLSLSRGTFRGKYHNHRRCIECVKNCLIVGFAKEALRCRLY